MQDILAVHKIEGQEKLLDDTAGLLLCKHSQGFDLFQKISACNQLCYDVVVAVIVEKFKDSGDVGMLCFLENLELLFVELFVDSVHLKTLFLDYLDGACNTSFAVLAQMHSAKRTCAKFLSHVVKLVESIDLFKLH